MNELEFYKDLCYKLYLQLETVCAALITVEKEEGFDYGHPEAFTIAEAVIDNKQARKE